MLKLRAGIQEVPPDHKGGYDLKRGEIETTQESYEEARNVLRAEVESEHPGWRIIYLMTVPRLAVVE